MKKYLLLFLVSSAGCQIPTGSAPGRIRPIIAVPIIRRIVRSEPTPIVDATGSQQTASDAGDVVLAREPNETPVERGIVRPGPRPGPIGPGPIRPRPFRREESIEFVNFDESAMQANMPSRGWVANPAVGSRRVQWVMLTIKNCIPCEEAKKDFIDWMKKSKWVCDDSENAHVRIVDVDKWPEIDKQFEPEAFPEFVLVQDGREIARHQGYPGRQKLITEFNVATQSLPALMTGPEEPPFMAGSISKEKVDEVLDMLSDKPGRFMLPIKAFKKVMKGVEVSGPEHISGEYTNINGIKRFAFDADKKIYFQWGWIGVNMDGLFTDGQSVTVELPGLPDPSLKIEDYIDR